MDTIKNSVQLLIKRPTMLVFTFILSIIIAVAENMIITLLYGVYMLEKGSPFDAYINIIQFVFDTILVPEMAVKVILAVVIFVIAISLVLSLMLSGCFNILKNTLEGMNKEGINDFITGVKKYFLKMLSVNLWTMSLGILFFIYLLMASIPAAIFIDNAIDGTISVFAGILFAVITILVLFFSFTFYRQYMVFWYPSVMIYKENPLKMAKKVADNNFWSLLSKFIVYDIIFIIYEIIYISSYFSMADAQVISTTTNNILLVVNVTFKAIYMALVVCFVFFAFTDCNNKYRKKHQKNCYF